VQNALLNLGKNRGRNILLFGIILAVITSVAIAIIIFNTANQVIDEYSDIFNRRVTISQARRMATSGNRNQTPALSLEDALRFSESVYLQSTQVEIAGSTAVIAGSDPQSPSFWLEIAEKIGFRVKPGMTDSEFWDSLAYDGVNGGNVVFYLHSADLLSAFEADVRAMGLSDEFNVSINITEYTRLIGPVERLGSVAFAFLIVVLLLGAIIITLLCVISVNERKYEIGILRAMGMKKPHVAVGLMLEIIVITVAAFAFALGIAAVLANGVAGMIIDTESAITVQTTIGFISAAQILGLAILLSVVAGGFAVSKITKYEPSIILTERG